MECKNAAASSAKTRYRNYLLSEVWQGKRRLALAKAGHKCEKCGSNGRLQVHHLTYERVFDERPADLQVLCEDCHKLEHGRDVSPVFRDTLDMDALLDMEKERRAISLTNTA